MADKTALSISKDNTAHVKWTVYFFSRVKSSPLRIVINRSTMYIYEYVWYNINILLLVTKTYMISQKKLSASFPGEFSKTILNWVSENAETLEQRFAKKYPRSRNKFNVQVVNAAGSKRVIVLNAEGRVILDKKSSYKNVLNWQAMRKLGCPAQ